MSLLNSRNADWIIGAQAKASTLIKELCIEPVSMAYVIVEPGMAAGRVGEADLIKKSESRRAVCYALAAQYFGFSLVYLEAGSGASSPVPKEMISAVRKSINIPLIVGGGIRSARQAQEAVAAGADIIVTGTIIEEKFDTIKEIISAVKS
jgi:phosphoglycerol geranylgeranyltransferase